MQYGRFPARVTVGDQQWNRAAVVVDGTTVVVAAQTRVGRQRTVDVVLERSDLVELVPELNRNVVLRFADGGSWTVGTGDGCGCSSPLSTWYNRQRKRPARSSV